MNNDEIIKELEKVENKYKDKVFATGELNIHELVKSCRYKIQELNQENQQLKEQLNRKDKIINKIKEIFDNPKNSFSDGCDCKKIEKIIEEMFTNE